MATFLRTFSHDGIFSSACCGWGVHGRPPPFYSIYPLDSSYFASSNPILSKTKTSERILPVLSVRQYSKGSLGCMVVREGVLCVRKQVNVT
jgi:hypothetical protein